MSKVIPTLELATHVYLAPSANQAKDQEQHKPTGQDEATIVFENYSVLVFTYDSDASLASSPSLASMIQATWTDAHALV